jgi:DNA-binding response OmpR family regulator
MYVMKILVIEDDREAADYLQKAFAEAGHTAHLAATARPASPWPTAATTTS